jgi:DUF4097 and DUF4098 domain-containing protein YvlB
MKYEIKNLVDEIFRGAPENKKAADLKEEIYQNLTDRYDELIHGGKSDREAMEVIKSVMGDFTPLVDALGEKSSGSTGTGGAESAKAEPVNVFPAKGESVRQNGNVSGQYQTRAGNQQSSRETPKKRMSGTAKAWIIALSIILGLLIISGIVSFMVHRIWNSFDFGEFYFAGDEACSIGDAVISAEGVDSLNVKWVAGNVDIKFVESDKISFSEESTHVISTDMKMRYRVNDGVLEIMYGRSRNIFFGFWGRDYSKDLTIELPVSMSGTMDNIVIETVSANIKVDGKIDNPIEFIYTEAAAELRTLRIDTVSGNVAVGMIYVSDAVDIQTVSGKVDISLSETARLNVGTVSGEAIFRGEADNIDFESVSGSMQLYIGQFRTLDADTTSGQVRVILNSSEISGFAVDFDSLSGSFKSDFPTTVSGNRYTNGDGSASVDFDSVSGGLTISYASELGN